jgi:hypothetical protein
LRPKRRELAAESKGSDEKSMSSIEEVKAPCATRENKDRV